MLKKTIIALFCLIVIVLAGLGYFSFAFFSSLDDKQAPQSFVIEEGESVKQIAVGLARAGLIRSTFSFESYVWLKKLETKFQTGEYTLRPDMSIAKIIVLLTAGGTNEKTIKILEGWTNQDIADYLAGQGIVGQEEFLSATEKNYRAEFNFLEKEALEGFLFPDTYRIYNNASAEDIIKKMLANFDKKLTPELRADIAKNKMTVFDTIILASILEKELKSYEDKRKAASVFYKRLNANMALQADSTVNYVTGKKITIVTAEDLKIDSPYNTYKYRGLPPGPICNPGLDAIKAAIYPAKNDYWYFLTDKEGQAYFAETLAEHGENRVKHLNQ
ncbi:MAG: endolytic transglycosylase MltG [bacterium]